MKYTREHPSPEYQKAIALGIEYQKTHKGFTGRHTFQSFPLYRQLIQEYRTKTLLDYGAGKLEQFSYRNIRLLNHKGDTEKQVYPSWQEALGVEEIYPYDPCIPEIAHLPTKRFDGVICTDVLEHVPPSDMPWVVDLMFSFAQQWVYASVASYPGKKTLADGSLAHKTIKPAEWWVEVWHTVGQRYPDLLWELRFEPEVPPITHRRFHGKGAWWEECEGWWQVWKPQQLEELTPKQRAELEMIAHNKKVPIDPRAFGNQE